MFSFLKSPGIVDAVTAENLQQHFHWAMESFDRNFFYSNTVLVKPTRDYFPERSNNEFDMARGVCTRLLQYCGLSHWPIQLVAPQNFSPTIPPLLQLPTQKRFSQEEGHVSVVQQPAGIQPQLALPITYSSVMMKKPMDLVANMSKNIAQHYLFQSQLVPPTGPEGFDVASEVLAIFMGFGILIANSAYTFRGSCARCYDPRANRNAALSEDEAIYCLALFCHYKKIDNSAVTPTLKGYLRGRFKRARKQVVRDLNRGSLV